MQHIFIINPKAGQRNQTSRVLAMAERLRRDHNLDCVCMLTQSPGHATELARRAARSGEEVRLYACGGDGTAGEVAAGVAGYENAAMTVIPMGTGNDLLKNFGDDLPRFYEAEQLWNGPVFALDAIDCNGRLGLTIACSGIDARVADDVHRYSKNPLLNGRGSYLASLAVNFLFKGIGQTWTVTLDGEEQTGAFALVACCNGRYYGGGFMPVGEAMMDDGVLDTILVKSVSRLTFARFVRTYARGEADTVPEIARVVRAKEVRIRSAEGDIVTCLDGECLRSRDVTVRLSEKKVNFFGPAGCAPNATAKHFNG